MKKWKGRQIFSRCDTNYRERLKKFNLPHYFIAIDFNDSETRERVQSLGLKLVQSSLVPNKMYILEGIVKYGTRKKFKLVGVEDKVYFPGKFRRMSNTEMMKLVRSNKLKELGI